VSHQYRPPRSRRPRPPSKAPTNPKGFEGVPVLSAEEVERRVDVRGGGTPHEPVERPVRRAPPGRRPERTTARDALLLIGLAIVGLVAVSFLLPNGPLTGSPTTPPGTLAAAASIGTPSPVPTTPAVPSATALVVVDPSVEVTVPPTDAPTLAPTAAPATPAPTLRPGQTQHPTPKPTPVVTPNPTPGPTAPNSATVIVKLHVITNSGGSSFALASDWTMRITGTAAIGASQNDFPGSESGTAITIPAGKDYTISSNNFRPDYAAYPAASTDCHRASGTGLTAGTTVTCTITRNDRPRLRVITHVVNDDLGTAAASDWNVSIPDGNASPSSFAGSESGTVVVVGFGLTYTVTMSGGPSDYALSKSGDCGPTSLGLDDPATSCTFTFDDPTPSPTVPNAVLPILFPLAVPLVLRRRWRPSRRA
jgi:Prealbumin-like fold domain